VTTHLTTEYVPTDSLRLHPDNPRRGDVGSIKDSLERNGQYRAIVVSRPTMEVLAGNHTLLAARQLGWQEIAATFVDVDSEQARRTLLVDNRTSDLAGYDSHALAELLGELPDLEGTGYDDAALSELLDELAPAPVGADEPPPLPEEPETRPGDLLVLGPHRLLCADAREPASYARLLADERCEAMWTDPPYGVSYEGKTKRALRIEGDGAAGLDALLSEAFAAADSALSPGARLYVAHPAGELALTFGHAFVVQGWRLRQTLVWVKDQFVLGRSDYHYRHEPILYGHKPGEGRIGRGAAGWYGDNAQDSVLEVARPRASRDHPTTKPAELIERCLRNSVRRGDLVLDPFAGSGSTLVACEASGRAARLIELDPRFCDVVVGRFERLTGRRAERSRP
jgi:site-specific DNA-methyltransferase (adenine-specific)